MTALQRLQAAALIAVVAWLAINGATQVAALVHPPSATPAAPNQPPIPYYNPDGPTPAPIPAPKPTPASETCRSAFARAFLRSYRAHSDANGNVTETGIASMYVDVTTATESLN